MVKSLMDIINENVIIQEVASFRKRTVSQKRAVKKASRKAHRGTNWKTLNQGHGRPGYKRVKVGESTYVFVREGGQERAKKKMVGSKLGRSSYLKK